MVTTSGHSSDAASEFIESSRIQLRDDFFPKLRQVVLAMDPEDLWWRPNDASNSVGNLVLHLTGNVSQWVVGGVGGRDVVRDRPAEFAARGPMPATELIARLESALRDADEVLRDLPPEALLGRHSIQRYDVSTLQAIYHVVEHFSYHLGQILFIYKLRTGREPGFVYPV